MPTSFPSFIFRVQDMLQTPSWPVGAIKLMKWSKVTWFQHPTRINVRGQCDLNGLCSAVPPPAQPGLGASQCVRLFPCQFPLTQLMRVAPDMHLFYLYILALAFRGQSNPGALIPLPFVDSTTLQELFPSDVWDGGGGSKNCCENWFWICCSQYSF